MTTAQNSDTSYAEAAIEADAKVPAIHIWRDFHANRAQVFKAHTDPELFFDGERTADRAARHHAWDARLRFDLVAHAAR